MRPFALLLLLALPACEAGPMLGTEIVFGAGGAAVRPRVAANVGGLDVVLVSPPIR